MEQRNEKGIEVHVRSKKKKQRSSSTKGRESPDALIDRTMKINNQTMLAKNSLMLIKSPSDGAHGSLNINDKIPKQESLPEMPSGFNSNTILEGINTKINISHFEIMTGKTMPEKSFLT